MLLIVGRRFLVFVRFARGSGEEIRPLIVAGVVWNETAEKSGKLKDLELDLVALRRVRISLRRGEW
jgi:hypothetical protein